MRSSGRFSVVKMRICDVDLHMNRGCRCQSVAKLLIHQWVFICYLPSPLSPSREHMCTRHLQIKALDVAVVVMEVVVVMKARGDRHLFVGS